MATLATTHVNPSHFFLHRDKGFSGDALVNFVSLVGGGFSAEREHRGAIQ